MASIEFMSLMNSYCFGFFLFFTREKNTNNRNTHDSKRNCIALIRTQRAMILACVFFIFAPQDIRFMKQIIDSDLFLGTRVKIVNPPLE